MNWLNTLTSYVISGRDTMRYISLPTKRRYKLVSSCNVANMFLTRRNREVVDCKRYRVKNYSKLTNFRKFTRIEGYNGKYGSNPQGIKDFLDVFFKFDQIGREIDGRNWGKWYF